MTIKVIMVDVDGVVVVSGDARGRPTNLGAWSINLEKDLGLSVERLYDAFFKPHFLEILHGRADLHERLAPVLSEIAPHISCEQLVTYWFENDAQLDHVLLDDLAEIRSRGIEVHLATVQEHKRADYLWRTLGLCERFDAMHYAADLGCVKPAKEFFTAIEARTGFRGPEIFFIDDRARNIEAALACGWRAAIWTGEQRLRALLAEQEF
jgi:putative hydrolase of the HAD superfamily